MTKYRIHPNVAGTYSVERLSNKSSMSGGGKHWQIIDIMDSKESAEKYAQQLVENDNWNSMNR